jgi:hypothetical protein
MLATNSLMTLQLKEEMIETELDQSSRSKTSTLTEFLTTSLQGTRIVTLTFNMRDIQIHMVSNESAHMLVIMDRADTIEIKANRIWGRVKTWEVLLVSQAQTS